MNSFVINGNDAECGITGFYKQKINKNKIIIACVIKLHNLLKADIQVNSCTQEILIFHEIEN